MSAVRVPSTPPEQSRSEPLSQATAQSGTIHATRHDTRPFPVWTTLGAAFALVAGALALLTRGQPAMGTLSITFVSIVLEALPFVMLGSLISGLIEVFVSRDRIAAILPRRHTPAVFVAASLGLIFPVCECAIIPVTRRLVRKGVPFSVGVAYLVAGPIVNPLVAASTAVAYGGGELAWLMTGARLLCGFTIAVFIALMMEEFFPGKRALLPHAFDEDKAHGHGGHCGCGQHHCEHADQPKQPIRRRVLTALEHGAEDFMQVSQFLIIGAFVAALSQTAVSRQAYLALSQTPATASLLMMTLAVVLNLCSEADAFVAASFRSVMPLTAQLAFLVLGPMLDIKLVAMYLSFVRQRALAVMVAMMCVLVFTMTWLLSFFGWA